MTCPSENEYGHSCTQGSHEGLTHHCECGVIWTAESDSELSPFAEIQLARTTVLGLRDVLRGIPVHHMTGPDTTAHDLLRRDLDHLETVLANIAAKESYGKKKQQ